MIALIKGIVISLEDGLAILDVGGVGFAVFVPANITLKIGKQYGALHAPARQRK